MAACKLTPMSMLSIVPITETNVVHENTYYLLYYLIVLNDIHNRLPQLLR